MADFYVRQGDDFTIADTLKDSAGNPVDLQGHTIQFSAIPVAGGDAIIDAAAATNGQTGDGADGSKGKVSYAGTGTATATAGYWLASWYDATSKVTYPNGGYILVAVTADAPVSGARFADSGDLEQRLGLTFTADEHVRANVLLEVASGLIQDETGQTISLVTADTLTIPGVYDERVRLPQRPVVSVASVTLAGRLLDADGYYLDGDEIVRTNIIGVVSQNRFGGFNVGFGSPDETLVIVYTHGYSTIPQTVKTVTLEMVARVWVNPGSVIQESTAGQQTTYAPYASPPRGLMLTDDEKAVLNALLRRHSTSTQLR